MMTIILKSKILKIEKPLVSVNWLFQNIEATNLIVLDATLAKVTSKNNEQKLIEENIPGTRFFDLKKVFSIQGASFPNTALSSKNFQKEVRKLGINSNSCIVVYDTHGLYSSPRAWWLFKTMGFKNIAVLDGGLPAWKNAGYIVKEKEEHFFEKGNFEANYNAELLINSNDVLNSLNDVSKQILDARSSGRFNSTDPEPRAEIRSGHIPNSKSLPHSSVLNGLELKTKAELELIFSDMNSGDKQLIFSCGSGITACVLALGATVAGYEKLAVYDGSWTEWGSLHHLPIEK